MKKNIYAGIIGLGEWGKYIVKTIKKNHPNVILKSATFKKSKYKYLLPNDCKIYLNWKKMIFNENLDCVFVAMPPKMNLRILKVFKNKKIPLFLEKPLADNLNDAKQIYKLSKNYYPYIQVNHIDLFNNAIIKAKKKLKGNVTKIQGFISSPSPNRSFLKPLWDYAPHFIAITLTFFNQLPKKIEAFNLDIENNLKNKKERQMVRINMYFSNNKAAAIDAGNGTIKKIRKIYFFEKCKKYIYDNNSRNPLVLYKKKSKKKTIIKINNLPSLTSSISNFLKNLKNKNKKDILLGLNVVKILHLAEKSLFQKKKINFH